MKTVTTIQLVDSALQELINALSTPKVLPSIEQTTVTVLSTLLNYQLLIKDLLVQSSYPVKSIKDIEESLNDLTKAEREYIARYVFESGMIGGNLIDWATSYATSISVLRLDYLKTLQAYADLPALSRSKYKDNVFTFILNKVKEFITVLNADSLYITNSTVLSYLSNRTHTCLGSEEPTHRYTNQDPLTN